MTNSYCRNMNKPTRSLSGYRLVGRVAFIAVLLSSLFSARCRAQARPDSLPVRVAAPADSSADVWDIYYRFVTKKSRRPTERVESGFHPSIFPELAYAIQTGFAVGLTANLSFTSTNPEQNISTIITTPQYTQYKQVIIPVITNIWTKGNRYNIVSDWRYYTYSADNYGLGSGSPAMADDRLSYSYLRLHQSVLRQVAPNFSVGIGYALDYHWRIREENNTPQLNDDFQRYGSGNESVSSGPTFTMQYTNRRNPNNPQSGFFGSVLIRPNLRWLGSDQNWQSVVAEFRRYVPLSANGRHILAFWNMNWLSLGEQAPYLDLPSTGWDTYSNLGRGYTQGRFRGMNLLYLETEISGRAAQ